MIIRLKYFYDIAVILDPGCKFFSAKCDWFILKFIKWKLNDGRFSSRTVIIHYWDRPNQEINLKSHTNTVIPCK